MADWSELLTPTDAVLSVNGQTGAIILTKSDVGLSNVDNTSDANKPVSTATQAALDLKASVASLSAHTSDTNNPHAVTKTQVGLGSVTNDAQAKADFSGYTSKTTPVDADTAIINDSAASGAVKKLTWANIKATLKTYFDTLYAAVSHTHAESEITGLVSDLASKASTSSLNSHTSDTGNPHAVTKVQVGLGNADNTSDANKPVSTAVDALLPKYARVTGSNATTTGQSLVDITGLSIALEASTVYELEVWLSANTSADANGIQYAINYSAAGATIEAHLIGTFSGTAVRTDRLSAFNSASGNRYLQTSGQDGEIVIKGIVVTGANTGNLTVQHLKATSGTSTVRINSFLKVKKIS
jgi:hypothetical protein